MNNYDFILKNGKTISENMISKPISSTYPSLLKKVEALSAMGGTALGPGLLTSIAMAGEGLQGSIVIMLTDGEAGHGIGSGNGSEAFYLKVGEYAKEKGIMVNQLFI